jgi:ribonuclease BN (tRNA processing enzyme)
VVAYLSDHEPALGKRRLELSAEWTSGHALAESADLLIHDAQYTDEEYAERVGWGHSSLKHAIQFAALARAKHLVAFHHDPGHDDSTLERLIAEAISQEHPTFQVTAGAEGATFEVGAASIA